jgi:hypothetical protein
MRAGFCYGKRKKSTGRTRWGRLVDAAKPRPTGTMWAGFCCGMNKKSTGLTSGRAVNSQGQHRQRRRSKYQPTMRETRDTPTSQIVSLPLEPFFAPPQNGGTKNATRQRNDRPVRYPRRPPRIRRCRGGSARRPGRSARGGVSCLSLRWLLPRCVAAWWPWLFPRPAPCVVPGSLCPSVAPSAAVAPAALIAFVAACALALIGPASLIPSGCRSWVAPFVWPWAWRFPWPCSGSWRFSPDSPIHFHV